MGLPYQHTNPPRTASGPRLTALGDDTPAGLLPVTWDIRRGYTPTGATWRSSTGLDPYAHLLNWVGNAQRYAASKGYQLSQDQINEVARFGTGDMAAQPNSGFNAAAYGGEVNSHQLNPGQTVEAVLAGHRASETPGSWGTAGQAAQTATPALGDFLHHTLDPTQQLFYQTNPGLYWHWAGQSFAPNVNTPRADWWNNRYQQAQADYGVAGVGNPNLQFTDWLDKNYPQISQEFGLMGAQQRGENTPFLPAGRPQL